VWWNVGRTARSAEKWEVLKELSRWCRIGGCPFVERVCVGTGLARRLAIDGGGVRRPERRGQ